MNLRTNHQGGLVLTYLFPLMILPRSALQEFEMWTFKRKLAHISKGDVMGMLYSRQHHIKHNSMHIVYVAVCTWKYI